MWYVCRHISRAASSSSDKHPELAVKCFTDRTEVDTAPPAYPRHMPVKARIFGSFVRMRRDFQSYVALTGSTPEIS